MKTGLIIAVLIIILAIGGILLYQTTKTNDQVKMINKEGNSMQKEDTIICDYL
jgi:hypothetical protein